MLLWYKETFLSTVIHLYVDEVLAVLDDVYVGVVDGLFMVFDASGPVRGRAKDLREDRYGSAGMHTHRTAEDNHAADFAEPTWTLVLMQLGTWYRCSPAVV